MKQTTPNRIPPDHRLLAAINADDGDGVRAALAAGVSPDAELKPYAQKEPALYWAARNGKTQALCALVEGGANVSVSAWGVPVLHLAAEQNATMCSALIEAGVDVHARGRRGQTALHRAAASGKAGATGVLLGAGADVTDKDIDGNTALHLGATTRGLAVPVIDVLVAANASLSARNAMSRTPLTVAASVLYDRPVVDRNCLRLIDSGADVTAPAATNKSKDPDLYGDQFTHLAARNGLCRSLKATLESGVDDDRIRSVMKAQMKRRYGKPAAPEPDPSAGL